MARGSVECPVCGHSLKGQLATGYRCMKCRAQYSTKFVRHLRRQHLRDLIERHFSVTVMEERVLVPQERIVQAAAQAQQAVQSIDDFIDLAQECPDPRELIREAADPSQLLHREQRYAPKLSVPPAAAAAARKDGHPTRRR